MAKEIRVKDPLQFKGRWNYVPSKGKKYPGKSMTLQNEALSMAQLLAKHITGGDKIQERQGVYVEDPDHEDLDGEKYFKMDIADRADVLEGIKRMGERLKNLEKEYAEEIKRREEASNEPIEAPTEKPEGTK